MPLPVNFSDQSGAGVISWLWTFGNGNSSTLQNPSAIYTQPGSYTVTLTIQTASGEKKTEKKDFIVVSGSPTASFESNSTGGCGPLEVKFTDKSTSGQGSIELREWIFGDGNISTEPNPTHVYQLPGVYHVTLQVTNSAGCTGIVTKNSLITVNRPDAKFTADQNSFCQVPATVNFSNQSSGNGTLNYTWDFGDGGQSTEESPSHIYSEAGSYQVQLQVKDSQGCIQETQTIITVKDRLLADWEISKTILCVGEKLSGIDRTTGEVVSREWQLGDGRTLADEEVEFSYPQSGEYTLSLEVWLADGCTAFVSQAIEVVPNAAISFDINRFCDNTIEFINTSTNYTSLKWHFGDFEESEEENPTIVFPRSGTYKIKLYATNPQGCLDSLIQDLQVMGNPIAGFFPNEKARCPSDLLLQGCAPYQVQFVNSTNAVSNYTSVWDFGDGSSSTEQNPVHIFTQPGSYTVRLTVTTEEGCTHSVTTKALVGDEPPTIQASLSTKSVCTKEPITFEESGGDATSWCWDIGDGAFINLPSFEYSYNKPGTYYIQMKAGKNGCWSDEVFKDTVIVKESYVDFSARKECDLSQPYTFHFTNLGIDKADTEWFWDFGDGNQAQGFHAQHTYDRPGNFTVSLIGNNSETGCVIEKKSTVLAFVMTPNISIQEERVCLGTRIRFNNASENVQRYIWRMGNGATFDSINMSYVYPNPGKYMVQVELRDVYNCFQQVNIPVEVVDLDIDFSSIKQSTCDQLEVQFTDKTTSSSALAEWIWDFGDGASSSEQHPTHVYTQPGNYEVRLNVSDQVGLYCSEVKTEMIAFTVPVPEFSPTRANVCIDERVIFTNTTLHATDFQWDLGNEEVSTLENPEVRYQEAGEYQVRLVASDNMGCSQEKTITMRVTQPQASFSVSQLSAECPPLIVNFTDNSDGDIASWQWSFGSSGQSNIESPSHAFTIPGNYQVALTVVDAAGCEHTKALEELIVVGGPVGVASLPIEHCLGDEVFFEVTSDNASGFYADFGDGNVVKEELGTISHLYANAGDFLPSIILEDEKGCQVVVPNEQRVTVRPLPIDDSEYSPSMPFEGEAVTFIALADSMDFDREWFVLGEKLGEGDTLVALFPEVGALTYTLRATNEWGCVAEFEKELFVQGSLHFIPDAFTPNGDAYNPTFQILGLESGQWSLEVYNRWGQEVYRSAHYKGEWDGSNASDGMYYYYLQNKARPEKWYKGTIHIIR
ncbi:PKD domain-containing protein [Shiella aurantiaca]|uniref:PKD domain-containing protein n=1 Tax=Shiella aurantiaca TaxID=3058365 RepID=UPI00387373EC